MEINKLQEMWTDYDKRISENTRLNKEILKRLLISKPEKRFSKVIVKAGIEVVVIIAFIIYFFVFHVSFQPTTAFYLGLTVFMAAIGIPVIGHIRYFLKLYEMNFSESVISLRKKINKSEKLREKNNRYGRLMVPFILLSTWFISQDFKNTLTYTSRIFGEPVFLVAMISALIFLFLAIHFKTKTSIKIDQELAEIEELERD